jgi:hypothetical protein
MVAAASVGAQQQPASNVTELGIATSQTAAPVGLRGYLASAGTFLYETAKVENLSSKSISTLTFGVLIADPSSRKPPTLLRSSAVVSLPPGMRQDVSVRLLPALQLEDLRQTLSATPKVTLGVLAVEWADGTSWVFDLPDGATDFSSGTGRVVEPN